MLLAQVVSLMSRNQARFVIGFVVICILAGLGHRLSVELWLQPQSAQELLADADQRIQNFQRVKMHDGKKIWEIAATQARFFEDSRELLVDSPSMSLYLDSGEVIALRCREGRISLGEGMQEIVRMKLSGDLEMQLGGFSLKTQTALYDSAENTVSAPDTVYIVGQDMNVEARGYRIVMNEKRATLHAEVHSTLTRKRADGNT